MNAPEEREERGGETKTLMSALFIALLLLFTVPAILLGYKKLNLLLILLALMSLICLGNGFIPAYLLYCLQKYEEPIIHWQKNNTIVLLEAGTSKIPHTHTVKPSLFSFSRITTAAALYYRCKAITPECRILISGDDPFDNGKSEAATYGDTLVSLGVHPTDILLEPRSKNTFQNAEFTRDLLKKYPTDQILLVASALNLPRALLYFSYFDIHPIPVPSDFITIHFSKFPIAYYLTINDFAAHEFIGIARFYIYNLFGWNPQPSAIYTART